MTSEKREHHRGGSLPITAPTGANGKATQGFKVRVVLLQQGDQSRGGELIFYGSHGHQYLPEAAERSPRFRRLEALVPNPLRPDRLV